MPETFYSPDDNMPGHDKDLSDPLRPDIESSLAEVRQKLQVRKARRQHKRRLLVTSIAAALILSLFITGLYLYNTRKSKPDLTPIISQTKTVPVADSSIRLVTANGQTMILDHLHNDDTLDITALHLAASTSGLNTLYMPHGREIYAWLPDGTLSWATNGSTLRFPTAFTGAARDVEVTGEVTLTIAKDPVHPFTAHIRHGGIPIDIRVLGTSFNIYAYPDEPIIRTTVIDGHVQVSSQGREKNLFANEQITIGADSLWQYDQNVDTKNIIASQQGEFRFDGDSITKVLRILDRWYKEDIQNDIPPGELIYKGAVKKDISLDQALEHISNHKKAFKYQRIGQKMIVSL